MEVAQEYEVKFRLFEGNEANLEDFERYYSQVHEEYRQLGTTSVNMKVISYFFEGLSYLVKGDIEFWQGKYLDCQETYQQASRRFQLFLNGRNTNQLLDKLCNRYQKRVQGQISLSQAFSAPKGKMQIDMLNLALSHFNEESTMATEMKEEVSAFISYSRALFAEGMYWKQTAINISEGDSFEKKRALMNARRSLMQAAFINYKIRTFYYEIENEINEVTRVRILTKAEEYSNKGIEMSEDGLYDEAKEYYLQSVAYYERASKIARDTESRRSLLSMKTIIEASIFECDASKYFRKENSPAIAAKYYLDAAKLIDKAVAMFGSYGSSSLIKTFQAQKIYYQSMAKLTEGVTHYDAEEYETALEKFKAALTNVVETIKMAEESANETLIGLAKRARNDLEVYIQTAETLIF